MSFIMSHRMLSSAAGFVCFSAIVIALVIPFPGSCEQSDTGNLASSSVEIYLEPASSYINPGERCTLSVMVDDSADSLSCVFCNISFDPQVVDCITAEEGELYLNSSYSTFFNWDLLAADSLRVEDCVMGYRSFILTPGELYRTVFEGLENGTSPVIIEKVEVYDIDRIKLSAETGYGASISVGVTAGDESRTPLPGSLECYPNPFNPSTTLTFYPAALESGVYPESGELMIYSPAGGLIRTLYQGILKRGRNDFCWNGMNETGNPVSSGVYLAVLRTPASTYTHKMILVR